MKKLVLLFSVTLITFSTIAQEEKFSKEEVEEVIANAKAGEAEAQLVLGMCYYLAKDYKQAVYWYKKAAEQGFAKSQYNLGLCYEKGIGVKKDLNKAKYWYDKAVKNNSSF